jgi:hypothetical protein
MRMGGVTKHGQKRPDEVGPLADEEFAVLPEQLIAPTRGRLDGVRMLMAAVLGDGIETFLTSHPTAGKNRRRLYDETAAWLFSDDRTWPFSFMSLCDALEIDAQSVRELVLRLRSERSPLRRYPFKGHLSAAA